MDTVDNSRFIASFKAEALELLASLENRLLELEQHPHDDEALAAVFRVMHTVKGSSGMFGLDHIAQFSHRVESFLTELREGRLKLTPGFIDYTLKARDELLLMLEAPLEEGMVLPDESCRFLDEFGTYVEQSMCDRQEPQQRLFRIDFAPGRDLFLSGSRPMGIVRDLMELGNVLSIPNFSGIPRLSELEPESCYLSWKVFLQSNLSRNDVEDVFIFVADNARLDIDESGAEASDAVDEPLRLGEILVDAGCLSRDDLDEVLSMHKRIGQELVERNLVSETSVRDALEEQAFRREIREKRFQDDGADSVRVKSEKLDDLMALVGEMVTIHAQVCQAGKHAANAELDAVIERFGRLTEELRDNAMSIRMLPLDIVFTRFRRLVRDMSASLGKRIILDIHGGETEIDKSVLEKLGDPLVHLVRNSMDHGIETPLERAALGKEETGTIRIEASQDGASVIIAVEDDGRGLNRDAIYAKGLAMGLFRDGEPVSDEDVFAAIFQPGFSTAAEVTDVSGRGVGMDVVKKQIQALGGSVRVFSEAGQFCRIQLSIPLTLAIIEGLLVRIGTDAFVVPLSDVEVCVEFRRADREQDASYITLHGDLVPFISLRDKFDIPGERPDIEQLVIVHTTGGAVGLLVDYVVGSNQTVIKSLGRLYEQAEGIASATILGDGSVAMVLDVERLVDLAEQDEAVALGD